VNPARQFGPYEIIDQLGAGGMGEVFRARDSRLNRDVAIKVLPRDFASDADRLRRFEQEARTLAALNHPNVLIVFDTGVYDGAPYLVSELLEGKTLREEIHGVALSVRKASDLALQVAQGLAAAHGKGIIHRDGKPENLFVTTEGRVKILDFGLAKLRIAESRPLGGKARDPHADAGIRTPTKTGLSEAEGNQGSAGASPSQPVDAAASTQVEAVAAASGNESTEPGKVMGTPNYMAPEQVRGDSVDHRADIFAFGCVLYEMVSGQRPFRRDTAITTMAAILNDDAPECKLMAVEVTSAAGEYHEFRAAAPRELFAIAASSCGESSDDYEYAVSVDGERFVVLSQEAGSEPPAALTLVQNWPALARKQ
jgi:serine/threonine protein kinase